MFIGHFGAGLGVKKASPALSLGLLFMAVQFLDLLWPSFVLAGIEHVAINREPHAQIPLIFTDYPYTHSLLMSVVWAILFGVCYWLFKRDIQNALVLGLCVFSHWVLDLIVHIPDLPLYPGSSVKAGLGLWNYPVIENTIELGVYAAGLVIYLGATRAVNKKGTILIWILALLLLLTHVANMFSPPPSSPMAVAWAAEFMWVFVLLGFWADRNRTPKVVVAKRRAATYEPV